MERLSLHIKTPLKIHQEDQVSQLSKKRAVVFVEKAGKGKTLTCLASFISLYNRNKLDTVLVSTPLNAYVRGVWKSETREHTNIVAIDIEALYQKAGTNPDNVIKLLKKYPVVYCKHTHVKGQSKLMQMIIALTRCQVIVDEVHKLKNPRSSLSIWSKIVYANSAAMVGITASPLSKNMEDCYNIIHFVKPWYLGTFDSFKREFCEVEDKIIGRNPGGGLKKVEEIVGITSELALNRKLAGVVVKGANTLYPVWNYEQYFMAPPESKIYKKLAAGLFSSSLDVVTSAEDWFKRAMGEDVRETYNVKEVQRHSSRFLYMQFAADGIITPSGDIGGTSGAKCDKALEVLKKIYDKGESAIMYFEYYASLDKLEELVKQSGLKFKIMHSTGTKNIKEGELTEAMTLRQPHLILATKAGSESASYWFLNHVILFHIPTTPETFTQIVGRITRINTKFPDDLNVHIMMCENIDLYKLAVVCCKAAQMEMVTGTEENIPKKYKELYYKSDDVQLCKKYLLWHLK